MPTALIKPNSDLRREIRDYSPAEPHRRDYHKSIKNVVIETLKTGTMYEVESTGRWIFTFRLHMN
jgi:hypothetical protein